MKKLVIKVASTPKKNTQVTRLLVAMPNGYMYSNLLLKLYLKSLKYDGALKFNDFIPYNEDMK